MFAYIITVICFITFENSVNAATGILKPQEKPPEFASTPGCYLKDYDRMLEFKIPFSPMDGKSCIEFTCDYDGYINIVSCFSIDGNCQVKPGNKSLKYPDCCDTLDCGTSKDTNEEFDENRIGEDNSKLDTDIEKATDGPSAVKVEDTPAVNLTENNRNEKYLSVENTTIQNETDPESLTESPNIASTIPLENSTVKNVSNQTPEEQDEFEPETFAKTDAKSEIRNQETTKIETSESAKATVFKRESKVEETSSEEIEE